jgi:hypothetical protein
MHLPEPLPEGDDLRHKALYNWCNRLRDYCQSITLRRGPEAALTHTPAGMILRPNKVPRVPPPGSFPFQVYPAIEGLGADYMAANYPVNQWWTMFLVRQGQYGAEVVEGEAMDGYNTNPDAAVSQFQITAPATLTPIMVTSGQKNWNVWLEWDPVGMTQTVYDGDDAAAAAMAPAGGLGNVAAWPSFPAWDGRHWLIAKIDCSTNASTLGPAIVRQFLREDILIPTIRLCGYGTGNYIYVPGYMGM